MRSPVSGLAAAAEAGGKEGRLTGLLLESLDSAAVALDGDDVVRVANPAATELGIVDGDKVALPELQGLVRAVRRDGTTRQLEVDIPSTGRSPAGVVPAVVRVMPAGDDDVLILVSDLSEARRVDAVRRDFVANVSHELKTPVGALMLLAEAIEQGLDDRGAVSHFTSQLRREASRLSRLVQELIDLSRLQGGELAPAETLVDVDRVVAEAVDRAKLAAASKQITVVASAPSGLVVRGDESQLITAAANLLDNAVAYSPDRAQVSVEVRRSGRWAEIAVIDRGIGIAANDLDRIFERFYRVDPARSRATGGTGLGLAIVKHVVANHGGEVKVRSELGKGSTFTVRLPLECASSSGRPS